MRVKQYNILPVMDLIYYIIYTMQHIKYYSIRIYLSYNYAESQESLHKYANIVNTSITPLKIIRWYMHKNIIFRNSLISRYRPISPRCIHTMVQYLSMHYARLY